MANKNFHVTRIFGGKEPQPAPAAGSQQYARPLMNPADQAVAESLTTTTRRRIKGPHGTNPAWSYHLSVTSAGGAGSALNVFYSDLPDPDPATAGHWKASGITAIALDAVATFFATKQDAWPEWIMFEATIVSGTAQLWGYTKVAGIDPQ